MAKGLDLRQGLLAAAERLGQGKDVAHDGARGGEGTGTGAVEHRLAHGVAHHVDGVHRAGHGGELVRARDHRGVHASLDALGGVARDAQQLDGVAKVLGHGDVLGCDVADALLVDVVGGDARVEAHRGEDGCLARGVKAVDVGRRVRLGVAQALRVGENLLVAQSLGGHAGQDVVGGAVEDARHGEEAVAHEAVLDGVDHRDAAGCRGLAAKLDARRARQSGQAFDMAAKQGLVGRDHVLVRGEGRLVDLGGGVLPADELNHDVDVGVAHDLVPVVGEGVAGDAAGGRGARVERAATLDAEIDAVALHVVVVVRQDEPGDAAAHGAEADDADVHGVHVVSFVLARHACPCGGAACVSQQIVADAWQACASLPPYAVALRARVGRGSCLGPSRASDLTRGAMGRGTPGREAIRARGAPRARPQSRR